MSFDFRMILDLLILALLLGTVVHASILNRNLNRLRSGRSELDAIVQELSASVVRAEAAIQGMKRNAAECGSELQKQINVARTLSDELHIMNESGNNLAQRLEKSARATRAAVQPDGFESAAPSPARNLRPVMPEPASVARRPAADPDAGARKAVSASQAERELFAAIESARKGAA